MATIRDVAQHANVSVGTVSNYLNNRAKVSEATSRRIEEAIRALDYRVHLGARGLRAGTSRTVGLVVPNIANPFHAEVARAADVALRAQGYQSLLCDSAEDSALENAHLINLARRHVDGILLTQSGNREDLAGLVRDLGVPTVFLDRAVDGMPSVVTDSVRGGMMAARHLLALGHRDIGMLVGEPNVQNIQNRMAGFVGELARNGVEIEPAAVLAGKQERLFGERVVELLQAEPRPTAVFATNDIVAIGAWHRLMELGMRIPEDISLVGFDDIDMSSLTVPPLTTVAQDKVGMGERGVRMLLEIIAGTSGRDAALVALPPRLVVRGSAGAPPKRRSTGARGGGERGRG